jgi:hypothetical protein
MLDFAKQMTQDRQFAVVLTAGFNERCPLALRVNECNGDFSPIDRFLH